MLIESERSSSLNDPTFYFLDQRQGSSVSVSGRSIIVVVAILFFIIMSGGMRG